MRVSANHGTSWQALAAPSTNTKLDTETSVPYHTFVQLPSSLRRHPCASSPWSATKTSATSSPTGSKEILAFINSSIGDRGYPPTLREIGRQFGIKSTNGVNDHLRALEKKGYLQREDMKSRALRPVDTVGQTVDVPVLGKVAAGQPLLAVRNYEDTVKVDRFFIGQNREVFALRVKGDSDDRGRHPRRRLRLRPQAAAGQRRATSWWP